MYFLSGVILLVGAAFIICFDPNFSTSIFYFSVKTSDDISIIVVILLIVFAIYCFNKHIKENNK